MDTWVSRNTSSDRDIPDIKCPSDVHGQSLSSRNKWLPCTKIPLPSPLKSTRWTESCPLSKSILLRDPYRGQLAYIPTFATGRIRLTRPKLETKRTKKFLPSVKLCHKPYVSEIMVTSDTGLSRNTKRPMVIGLSILPRLWSNNKFFTEPIPSKPSLSSQ